MGLFKKLFLGAVAVAAAPIVAPAAAAAAAGAAAAGMAAAGAAATAAAGAVGAAGAAVAGTAVGGAAVGAMTAVGSAVGTAAGAVGVTSVATVAAGSATGAAAVGTIATSAAVGAQQSYSAKTKMDEAKAIEAAAKDKYQASERRFSNTQKETSRAISELADNKKKIAETLQEFNQVFRKIKNPTEFGQIAINDAGFRTVDASVNWDAYPIALQKISEGILASYAGGNIVGLAVTGGLSCGAVAGTGTLVSTLSGAAATNATLAALGGGTLASGGLGMAGGAVVAKGLAFAPAFAIGGAMLNYKSSQVLDDAKHLRWEVEAAVANMDRATPYLNRLTSLSQGMSYNINQTFNAFRPIWNRVRTIVYTDGHVDAAKMTKAEKMTFFAAIGLAKVMELQATKNFVRAENSQNEYDVTTLISKSEIDECRYNARGLVQIGRMPAENLDQVIQMANAETKREAEEKIRAAETARLRTINNSKVNSNRKSDTSRLAKENEAIRRQNERLMNRLANLEGRRKK